MCGIVGSINLKFNTSKVDRLMGHRGPDEQNTLEIDNVIFHNLFKIEFLYSSGLINLRLIGFVRSII